MNITYCPKCENISFKIYKDGSIECKFCHKKISKKDKDNKKHTMNYVLDSFKTEFLNKKS